VPSWLRAEMAKRQAEAAAKKAEEDAKDRDDDELEAAPARKAGGAPGAACSVVMWLLGWDSRYGTAGMGQQGWNSRDGTAGVGQQAYGCERCRRCASFV
jgi:RNA 3'-terminal phosphate cyclase